MQAQSDVKQRKKVWSVWSVVIRPVIRCKKWVIRVIRGDKKSWWGFFSLRLRITRITHYLQRITGRITPDHTDRRELVSHNLLRLSFLTIWHSSLLLHITGSRCLNCVDSIIENKTNIPVQKGTSKIRQHVIGDGCTTVPRTPLQCWVRQES